MNEPVSAPYKRSVPQPFGNRWLIRATLTTQSELHIGDGGEGCIQERARLAKKDMPGQDDESDASTVCVDYRDVAYIPGSSIKGPLRALVSVMDPVTKEALIHADWKALLGSDKPDGADASGGKLEFWDAFHSAGKGTAAQAFVPKPQNKTELLADRNRPWWDPVRRTCIAVSDSLDRRTRTAKESLLYHIEYVPVGETFAFDISGDDLGVADIAGLLLLLDQFNTGEAALGAQTSNGWGCIECKVKEICRLDATCLAKWKQNPRPGLAACEPVDEDTRRAIIKHLPPLVSRRVLDRADAAREQPNNDQEKTLNLPRENGTLIIHLKLTLESPWLIRDPRQRERSEAARKLMEQKRITEADKPPNAVAIQSESGIPFVPAKSLRGALRSRAEMILRTLGMDCAAHPGDIRPVTTKGKGTEAVLALIQHGSAKDKIKPADLAARLFGFGGWQSPLDVPRLIVPEGTPSPKEHHQEFVAIDRFTGGAANQAKFDAVLAGMTALTGTLTIDLNRLKQVDENLAALGLLALVLRDFAEGDIPIGSGSSKGQGQCSVVATVIEKGTTHASLTDWFEHSNLLKKSLPALHDRSLQRTPPPAHIDTPAPVG